MAPERVFIVDDDDLVRLILERQIISILSDIKFHSFSRGRQFLDFLHEEAAHGKKFTPAILFLDIKMPELSGWDVLEELLHLPGNYKTAFFSHTQVYIYSSSIDPQDVDRARTIPFLREYLVKPVSREKLQTILSSA